MRRTEVYRYPVTQRASGRCEYCHYPQEMSNGVLDIEHIVPVSVGGITDMDNLALACRHCNNHKAVKVTGTDPNTLLVERLFHPRRDVWNEYFYLNRKTGEIVGLTSVGRAISNSSRTFDEPPFSFNYQAAIDSFRCFVMIQKKKLHDFFTSLKECEVTLTKIIPLCLKQGDEEWELLVFLLLM